MQLREKWTYSLNGAAYAVAKGVRLLRTFKEPSGKHTIVLDDGYDQASEALREFFDGEPLVNARAYAECRRYIIDEMHSTSTHKEITTYEASATVR